MHVPRRAVLRLFLTVWAAAPLGGCVGPEAPTPVSVSWPELSEVIEGIFLGSGPLAAGECVAPPGSPGVWSSYPSGATITLVLSSTIDAEGRATLERAVADLRSVIRCLFELVIGRSDEPDPVPQPFQITSADVPAARIRATCSPGGVGCTTFVAREGPILLSARTIQELDTRQWLKVHELGHAMGLCHVREERMPSAVMADPSGRAVEGHFSDLELEAFRAVYAAGLEPGATRADFQRAGLVR